MTGHANSELLDLLNRLCNQTLEDDQARHLTEILEQDIAARDVYIDMMHLNNSMMDCCDGDRMRPWREPANMKMATPKAEPHKIREIRRTLEHARFARERFPKPRWCAAALIVSFAIAGAGVVFWHWTTTSSRLVTTPSRPLPHSRIRTAATATIEWSSADCQWIGDQPSNEQKSLASGAEIRLSQGAVDLRFAMGARVRLQGPCRFVINSANSASLIVGSLTANVPEPAHGFSVDLPNGKVVDLGTEFGLVVDDFGLSEVGVFNGKVAAYQNREAVADTDVELHEGDALQWSVGGTRRMDLARRRFSPSQSSTDIQELNQPALFDDFNDHVLATNQWLSLGAVTEVDGVLQLGRASAELDRDNVPYLISTRQFDPDDGVITVTGKVMFSRPMHNLSGAVSIFTRAERERGSFPRSNYAYLATGIRSTFWPVSRVSGESLRILVRPLDDGPNLGLLGEEFEEKKASSNWFFHLVDDGVNVQMTITSADDASIRKTVACRSLFHGGSNHVAIEGDPNAVILLDDIAIYQAAND